MTPIGENELRRELAAADAPVGPSTEDLSSTVIRRGRGVQRRRAGVAVAATLALLAGGVTVANQFLPQRSTQPAEPLPPVVTSQSPAVPDTPTPIPPPVTETTASDVEPATAPWHSTSRLPGVFGDIGALAPLHWEAPAEGDSEAWGAAGDFVLSCAGEDLTIPALTSVTAGRTIGSLGPESVSNESVLIFATQDAAIAFMQQLEAGGRDCAARSPWLPKQPSGTEPVQYPIVRTNWAVSYVPDLADYAFTWRTWDEAVLDDSDETFVEFPGGSATVWVRQGNVVMMAGFSGELVGDPANQPDMLEQLMPAIDHVRERL